ncbi:MAG: glutathione S-transferase family protein [Gammaproteobacteria bacterium TMED112]|mgnify:FL=1|nr:MAG: glutathione S-transferase family protein [Gammaproteobacteria bacterium TMED112]
MKIYSCENSRSLRPLWTAEEMGLDYKLELLPFPPRVFQKDYLDINILGTVPYLTDGKVKLTESVAMCQYMVKKYGPTDLEVAPNEEDYPNYLNWLFHADATLTFPQTVVLRYKFQEPGVADGAIEGYSRWFVSRLKLLESSLEGKEYLCSNRFTIADICVSYAIHLANNLEIHQALKPNIKRWSDKLFEREAFKKALTIK